jgi:mannose-6-phosphate isomerase-like protein (cupin superfamily)
MSRRLTGEVGCGQGQHCGRAGEALQALRPGDRRRAERARRDARQGPGEFVWHRRDHEDELSLVASGAFGMQLRDRTVRVGEGEFIIVTRALSTAPRPSATLRSCCSNR